jgi:hypothetical protein
VLEGSQQKMNVLVSLHKGYGLGDAVQMSAVLRHARKYRPHWVMDLQAEEGRHCIGRGIADAHFEFGKNPAPDKVYDAEVEILLYDTWANWQDRPNTRVSSCLHERFGIPWDEECGRYQINVRPESVKSAQAMVGGWIQGSGKTGYERSTTRYVAVHYEGDSSQPRKNLSHEQADAVCGAVEALDCVPIILDWRSRSPLEYRKLRHPSDWGGDAEMVCAVIAECSAFVGIDSGPSKCASATDTPALVVWTGHHPAPFHDPAPNTTHLVPRGYHGLHPVCNDPGVIEWFEAHHDVRQYDNGLVGEIATWLMGVLR